MQRYTSRSLKIGRVSRFAVPRRSPGGWASFPANSLSASPHLCARADTASICCAYLRKERCVKVLETALPCVKLLEPCVFNDDRGFFLESWNARAFAAA